jgi:hypothetical protein
MIAAGVRHIGNDLDSLPAIAVDPIRVMGYLRTFKRIFGFRSLLVLPPGAVFAQRRVFVRFAFATVFE